MRYLPIQFIAIATNVSVIAVVAARPPIMPIVSTMSTMLFTPVGNHPYGANHPLPRIHTYVAAPVDSPSELARKDIRTST
jgi:1-acyl-sn-glycerol-3-phosphate acyltransferase